MAGVSFPVTRSAAEALVVASPAARSQTVATLASLGIAATEYDDPYAAMAELCRRPMVFRAVILSLAGVYTEELDIISAIKSRFPHVEIWLTHTDGRYSSLAEAMRLGAEGLLADDGLHRIAAASPPPAAPAASTAPQLIIASPTPSIDEEPSEFASKTNGHQSAPPSHSSHFSPSEEPGFGEPVLTADELRALLQDTPSTELEPEKGDN